LLIQTRLHSSFHLPNLDKVANLANPIGGHFELLESVILFYQVKKEEEWEEFFEDDATRELKQIFQGQAAMAETVRELHRKMDEIIGK
jgi:hypothetical protein